MALYLQSWGDDTLPCNIPDNNDIELSKQVGLLSPNNIDCDFESDDFESDDFENEGNMFINELDLATIDMALGYNFNTHEVITNKIQQNIEIRVIKRFKNFLIGSIDGSPTAQIPISLNNYVTIGELILCDIIYKPIGKNLWKVIYIHPKIEPVLLSVNEVNNNIALKLMVNHQNIGQMIGKNGNNIKKIGENYLLDNPDIIKYMNLDKNLFPQFNIYNYLIN